MAPLRPVERTKILRMSAAQARSSLSSRLSRSRLLRWRFGAPLAETFVLVPQELRTCDPSFVSELQAGLLGLAGYTVETQGQSPFDIEAPSDCWLRELHGFGWLRHLSACGTAEAQGLAVQLVSDWLQRHAGHGGLPWAPAVAGRRLVSWITHAGLLLEGTSPAVYDRITHSMGDHIVHLAATWRSAPAGEDQLLALIALLAADLCFDGREKSLAQSGETLSRALARQIHDDGGHVSRDPQVLVNLLLDLMPLRHCFMTRGLGMPEGLETAVARMMPMVRFMRLGDGGLARFNGVGPSSLESVTTVLAYDPRPEVDLSAAPASGYAKLVRGRMAVLIDIGEPPPLQMAIRAHAGCLSFELSIGSALVFANCGAPGPAHMEHLARARATASHNTLCLGERSSSRLVRQTLLERATGGVPISGPARVIHEIGDVDGGVVINASHDGYVADFGLLHRRRMTIDAAGTRLEGVDRLEAPSGHLRLTRDLPFSIHFHLPGAIEIERITAGSSLILALPDGERWSFAVDGAVLSIEQSAMLAELGGPVASLQIVLRGATFGETEVRWQMSRQ